MQETPFKIYVFVSDFPYALSKHMPGCLPVTVNTTTTANIIRIKQQPLTNMKLENTYKSHKHVFDKTTTCKRNNDCSSSKLWRMLVRMLDVISGSGREEAGGVQYSIKRKSPLRVFGYNL